MRKIIFPLAAVAALLLVAGCNGPEQKLGRGLSNTFEVVRWGELRRSVELNSIEPLPGYGYYGIVHGFDRSLQRVGIGVFEVATFPIPTPTYGPILAKSPSDATSIYTEKLFDPDPVFPASYKPGLFSDSLFDTDTYTGFSGGDVAPFVPGSRFSIFSN
jgi:putative exosortase-associated protein (TIGR04073 family)